MKNITWEELGDIIDKMSHEQLLSDATIQDSNTGEFCSVTSVEFNEEDNDNPYMIVDM